MEQTVISIPFGYCVGQAAPNLPRREYRSPDAAWEDDTRRTNYRLQDGQQVKLLADTKGDFSAGYFTVPAGTTGKVITARTPRVCRKTGTQSAWFANVDVMVDGLRGRIRVPHSALQVLRLGSTADATAA